MTNDRTYSVATHGFTLLQITIALILLALITGTILMGHEILEAYKIHAQISQIASFDEAVANFNDKYEGLPGDLLAIKADREGLPAGDGTPSHGDSDGKISPCNLGWQWHLGCETALFWPHLSISGMISGNFSADSRFTDSRLEHVGSMEPYLPKSPLAEGVSVSIWNTDGTQPSPKPQMPYGNYYEISRILGATSERLVDDHNAVSPQQALAFDTKTDDGMPFSGRVLVNGEANWPHDAWGTFAKTGQSSCVYTDRTYNVGYLLRAKSPLCHLAVRLECCQKKP